MGLLDTALVQNLADGKLPAVEVKLETATLINLVVGVIIAGIVLMAIHKLLTKK